MFGQVKFNIKRSGKPLPINDVWIAAHALETGSVVVSYDTHFLLTDTFKKRIFNQHSDDVVLQYEAVRLNRIVHQRPDFDSASVFSLFVRRYLDFLPYLKVQREAYKQRVLNGQA
jgi:hypothetical protein